MSKYLVIIAIIGAAILLVGAVFCTYQLFRLVQTDASCRGLKHPKLWGWFSITGNNSSGILFYLIARKKHPITSMSDEQKTFMDQCKKKIGIGLIVICVGAILCIWCLFLS